VKGTKEITTRINHSAALKEAMRLYVVGFNKKNKTNYSVSFPNKYKIKLQVLQKTSRSASPSPVPGAQGGR
jgi:hypothetical protein